MSRLDELVSRLARGSGFTSIAQSSRDTKLLCLQRFVRMFAYGTSFLILVHFLTSLDISDERVGLFMTLTLLGDVVISFALTLVTDQLGRRRVLAAGCALMAMSGVTFSLSSSYWLLVSASVTGVISPSGNEVGPFKAIEESILAHLTEKDKRSDIFAWYMLFGTAGAALGTFLCGLLVEGLQGLENWTTTAAYRVVFVVYAVLGLIKLGLTIALSPIVELEAPEPEYEAVGMELEADVLLAGSSDEDEATPVPTSRSQAKGTAASSSLLDRVRSMLPHVSPLSRSILYRLILLFALDSFASGMASPSWLTYFFTAVHSLKPSLLGTLFLTTNVLATLSNLAALPLARRLGPLKTMTFTHLPSAILLCLVPLPPTTASGTWLAVVLLCLRACTSSMDQAPRQAFLSAAVLPAERTVVLGIVNVAKTLAQAGGLGSAGVLAGARLWVVVLSGAGIMKACYDLLMLWMFLGLKERDDVETSGRSTEARSLDVAQTEQGHK